MNRIRALIMAVVLAAGLTVAVSTIESATLAPAHADASGKMTYNEWAITEATDTNDWVNSECDCTGDASYYNNGGRHEKIVSYTANNSTFAADICIVQIEYERSFTSQPWIIYSGDFSNRLSCSGVPNYTYY